MKKHFIFGFVTCLCSILLLSGFAIAYTSFFGVPDGYDEPHYFVEIPYVLPQNLANGLQTSPAIDRIRVFETYTQIIFTNDFEEYLGVDILDRDIRAMENLLSINSVRSADWIGIALPNCIAVSPTLSLDFKPVQRNGEWVLVGQPNALCTYRGAE